LTSASRSASRTSRKPASTSASLSLPRPVSFLSAWSRRSVSDSNTLGPFKAELALVAVEVRRRPPHDVVDGGPRHTFPLCDFAVGPVELPGEVQDAALMVGQQRAVEVEEAQLALAASGTVKHLALTVYGVPQRPWAPFSSLRSTNCTSQSMPSTTAASATRPIMPATTARKMRVRAVG